jgi:RNA polymerase sigma-70 factor (ECF subfamily)
MAVSSIASHAPTCWNASLPWALPQARRGGTRRGVRVGEVVGVAAVDGRTAGSSLDLRLMEAIKAGEASALEALYERYGRVVLALCRRILGDPRDAEEAMLDAFAQVWEQGDRYDPGRASPLSYLMTVARSRAIDRARALGRHRALLSDGDEVLLAAPDRGMPVPPSALSALLSAESRSAIEDALRALPPEQREALELAFFAGLSHREVAERLATPLGTVKTRIRQGLLRLRDILVRVLREADQ